MMYTVFALKARHELTWEDFPYIENPVFSHERAMTALAGSYDINGRRVHNIEEFKRKHVPYYSRSFNHQIVSDELRRQFFSGQFFSVARDKIPFSPSFKWRALEDHPDGGEWYVTHPIYGDLLKQKMEDLAKRLSAQKRRWMAEEAEENASAAALASVAKWVVEKRSSEKANPSAADQLDGLVNRTDDRQSDSKLDNMGISKPLKCPTPEDIEIAKSIGCTPRHIEAREIVARDFLKNNEFAKDQIEDALGAPDGSKKGGVDLSRPVEIITFPPPEKMTQYVKSHGYPGNWFDPLSTQAPEMLGINGETRTLKSFTVVPGRGLKSIAKPVVDTWTTPQAPKATSGGGVQLLVNDETKRMISSINMKGI